MKSIRNIFNPITSMFNINYQKRLIKSTELSLYEAKQKYIQAAQNAQHFSAEVAYQGNRINMLHGMVNQLKGLKNDEISSITTVAVVPSNAASLGQGIRLSST